MKENTPEQHVTYKADMFNFKPKIEGEISILIELGEHFPNIRQIKY